MEHLVKLCRQHNIVYPVECLINNTALTCYNYGTLGLLIKTNILRQWQAAVTSQKNVFAVDDNLSSENEVRYVSSLKERTPNKIAVQPRTSMTSGVLDHYLPTLHRVNYRIPFGLAQHGICTRQPSPTGEDHFLFGSDVYEELLVQYYCPVGLASRWTDHWHRQRLRWWRKLASYPSNFSSVDIDSGDEKLSTEIHIQYAFPWGTETLETINNLGPDLLLQRQNESGISHQGKHSRKTLVPNVIQMQAVLEKGLLALLLDALTHCAVAGNSVTDKRTVLALHPCIAPYNVAVVVDSNKSLAEVTEVTEYVINQLENAGISVLHLPKNSSKNLPDLYHKFDEMGIPQVAILNDTTLTSGILQLRNRETGIKMKINLVKLQDYIKQSLKLPAYD